MTQPAATTLTLDTAQSGLSLGLFATGKPAVIRTFAQARGSELLHPALADMLAEAGITPRQLGRVVVTVGPGSFTGIRIGLAVADALRHTVPSLQVIGLPSLAVLAAEHAATGPITVVLPAAGPDVYTQSFDAAGTPEKAPACLPLAGLSLDPAHHYLVGAGVLLDAPRQTLVQHASPATMYAMAENQASHQPPLPVYLKPLTYKASA